MSFVRYVRYTCLLQMFRCSFHASAGVFQRWDVFNFGQVKFTDFFFSYFALYFWHSIKKSWANLGLQIISYLLKVLQFWLYVFRIYFELIFVDCMKYISSVIFYMNIHLWPVMSVEWIVFSLPQYLKSAAYIGVCLFLESPVPLRYLPIFTSVPYCHEHPDFISLKAQTVSFSRLVLPVLGSCTFVWVWELAWPFLHTEVCRGFCWVCSSVWGRAGILTVSSLSPEPRASPLQSERGATQLCPTLQPMDYTVHSRPAYWSGQPFPAPGGLPSPGIEPRSPALRADSFPAEPRRKPTWCDCSQRRRKPTWCDCSQPRRKPTGCDCSQPCFVDFSA